MAFCMNCGQEIPNGAKFCSNCGTATGEVKVEAPERKTKFEGELHKCPNCGEVIDAFVTICPVCNYELRGAQGTSRVHELAQKLEAAKDEEQKLELISNFYIPNTKEDIYEFFILAYSNISAGGYGEEAWFAKLEQAHLKGKLAFGDSAEFARIDELYKKIKKDTSKNETKKRTSTSLIILGICAIVLGVALFLFCDDFFIFMVPLCLVGIVLIPIGCWGLGGSKKRRRK